MAYIDIPSAAVVISQFNPHKLGLRQPIIYYVQSLNIITSDLLNNEIIAGGYCIPKV